MMRQVEAGRDVQFDYTEQYETEMPKLKLKEQGANHINLIMKTADFWVRKALDDSV